MGTVEKIWKLNGALLFLPEQFTIDLRWQICFETHNHLHVHLIQLNQAIHQHSQQLRC